ncbi:MAG: cation:proton antiporter, partial [Gammaproteobacteria bacterium]|nr:cation:proton antiporter [Gammaproteobacteria bacterium]
IVLSDSFFRDYEIAGSQRTSIRQLIMPLEVILVPIFFILMGMQVKLESFLSWPVVAVAGALLVAAVIGKLVSGLGAGRKANRWIVGFGMLPRGEVGLVFAAIGRTLGVIDDAVFSAMVLMIIVTTLAAPPLLKLAVSRQERRAAAA